MGHGYIRPKLGKTNLLIRLAILNSELSRTANPIVSGPVEACTNQVKPEVVCAFMRSLMNI